MNKNNRVPTNIRREVIRYNGENILTLCQSFDDGESYEVTILGYVPQINEKIITPIDTEEKRKELTDFLMDRPLLRINKVDFSI